MTREEFVELVYDMVSGYPDQPSVIVEEYDRLIAERDALFETKEGAYHERNQVVAALAKVFPSSLERHVGEDWGPDWLWVCIIDLPAGQVSWHIQTSELGLFTQIPRETGRVWDGHDTEEKYRRLRALPADYTISNEALHGRIKIQWSRIEELEAQRDAARAELTAALDLLTSAQIVRESMEAG